MNAAQRRCPQCRGERASTILTPSVAATVASNPDYTDRQRAKLLDELDSEEVLRIVRCLDCDMVFAPATPAAVLLDIVYGREASTQSSVNKILTRAKRLQQLDDWMRLVAAAHDRPDLRVLDLGCGWGDFLAVARSPGVEVVGYEPNRVAADYARQYGVTVVSSIDEITGDFDALVCDQVLEHVDDPRALLVTMAALARPHAVVLLGVPNFTGFDWAGEMRRLETVGTLSTKNINPIEHLNYFEERSLKEMATSAGFDAIERPGTDRIDALRQRSQDALRRLRHRGSTRLFFRPRGSA